MISSYGVGRYQAAEADVLFTPHGWIPNRTIRGVVYCHFANGSALNPLVQGANPGINGLLRAIVDHLGLPVISCDLGPRQMYIGITNGSTAITVGAGAGGTAGDAFDMDLDRAATIAAAGVPGGATITPTDATHATLSAAATGATGGSVLATITRGGGGGGGGGGKTWGNATATARVGAAIAQLQSAAYGAAPGKVILLGESMGGINALNYAKANLANVAALVGIVPVLGLLDIYNNNRGGGAPDITLAHGGAPPAAADPSTNPALWAGLPMQLWASAGDTICLLSVAQAFAAAAGPSCQLNTIVGAPPHGDSAVAAVPASAVLAFMQAHAA